MSREFWERTRKFSIRKLTVGAASILIGISPITSSVLQVITYADTIGEPQKASYIVNTTNTLQNLAIQIANPTPSYDTVSSHLATISDLISEYESERVNKSDYEAGSFENYENVAIEAKSQYDNLKSIYDAMVALRDSGKVQQYADTAVSIRSAHMTSDGRSEWALDGDIGEVGPTVAERTAAYEQILNMFTEVYPTIKAYADTVSTTTLQSIESKLNSAKGNLAPSAAKQVRDQGLLSEKLVTPVKVSNLNGTLTPDDKKNIRLALEDLEVFYSGWASTSKLIFNDNGTMTIVFDDDGSTATVNLSDFNIIQDPAVSPAPDPGEKKYTVSYSYVGAPSSEVPPAAVQLKSGEAIEFPEEGKEVSDRTTIYSLSWDKTITVVSDRDVNIVGTWTSTAKPTYTIRYKYEGSVPSGETAPSSVTGLYTGDAVTVPTNRTVQRPEGTYHLTWSTPTSSTVSDQDVEVVGTWSFTPVTAKTYKVTATYKTMDGKDLATADVQNIEDTKSYTTSAQNELTVKGVTYTLKTAPANATGTVSGSDVTVNYVYEVKDLAVNYAFNTTSGLVLPGIVTSLLPTSSTAKSGSVVTATPSSFSSQSDRVSGKPGQWVFIGWDAATKVVENTSLLFTGLWTFQEDASYKVTYRYAGDIPNGETAPATVSNLYAGDQIPVPKSKTV
ncbi:YSIRK-type signal peptide-containing protein, partial [Streptococcus suis]|nr:YSIRK-type signal peptide-containing protein [Streptococcus suis]